MNAVPQADLNTMSETKTLGELLYNGAVSELPSEAEWLHLVEAMARGDAHALHALHERSHRAVFTLLMRMVDDARAAEELTLQTFQRAWQNAVHYSRESGPVLAWLIRLARELALRAQSQASATGTQYRQRLQAAVARLTQQERELLESVYFSPVAIADAAVRLDESVESVTARLHIVLQKLSDAFASSKVAP